MNEQNIQNVSSLAGNQQAASGMQQPLINDAEAIKQMAVNDLKTIETLVQTGVMTQEQGQNLMNYVTKKAFEKYTLSQHNGQSPAAPAQSAGQMQQALLQENVPPEFFNKDGRIDVFDYLKNANVSFDEDELLKISELVEKIENKAVERYLREKKKKKTLNSENESAKQRLRANAQNTVSDCLNNLVFTREQIGKMSGAEFAKHERAIMDQLKKGLIK